MRDRRSTRSRKSDVTTKQRVFLARAVRTHCARAINSANRRARARAGPHFCFDLFSVTKPEPCGYTGVSYTFPAERITSATHLVVFTPPRSPRESSLSFRSSASESRDEAVLGPPRAPVTGQVYFLQRNCSTMTDQKSGMSRLLIVNEEAGRTRDRKEIGRR